jgi:pSer/pThr/pTyr-binding forkhead associated (FHA) protein
MGFLVITATREDDEYRYFRLQKGVNGIGSIGSRTTVEIRDREVSGQHAILVCTNTVARLLDLDSRNGTHVNGSKSEYAELKVGDVIRVGRTELVYVPFQYVAED